MKTGWHGKEWGSSSFPPALFLLIFIFYPLSLSVLLGVCEFCSFLFHVGFVYYVFISSRFFPLVSFFSAYFYNFLTSFFIKFIFIFGSGFLLAAWAFL